MRAPHRSCLRFAWCCLGRTSSLNNAPLHLPSGFNIKTGDQERHSHEATDRGHTTIADRIFIADATAREKIADRWTAIVQEKDINKFWSTWEDLHRLLLKMAREGLNLKD
jgi:hypothetical protein